MNLLCKQILLWATILLLVGCSSAGELVLPDQGNIDDKGMASPVAELEPTRVIWGAYNLLYDPVTSELRAIPVRDLSMHVNVTAFVTAPACPDCIALFIEGYNPEGWVYDIRVTLRNPTQLTGYDVRGTLLIGDETETRKLINPDEYTELFDNSDPPDRNPFKAFATDQPGRIFLPDTTHEVLYKISFPPPPQYNILFVIDASWPGNQKEPFRIYNQEIGEGLDDSDVETVEVVAYVQDWQGDVEHVRLDITPLGAPGPLDLDLVAGDIWSAELTNEWGASAGDYELWIEAKSVGNDVMLYDKVSLTIVPYGNTPPVWDDTIGIVSASPGEGEVIVTYGMANDPQTPVTYVVYYSEFSPIDFGTASTVESDIGSPTTVDGLTNGITYHFAVRARDAWGLEDGNTIELPATPVYGNIPPVWDGLPGVNSLTPLSEAMEVGFGSASDPDLPVTYNIYYSETTPIDFGIAPSVNVPSSPGTVSDLDNAKVYYFAVRAMDGLGMEDDNTLEMSGCPNLPPEWNTTIGIQTLTPLSESMQVEFGGATDPDTPVTYNIYYSLTTPIDFLTAPSVNVASSPGEVDGLSNAETYHFAVRTIDVLGLEDENTVELSGCPNTPPEWDSSVGIIDAQGGFGFAVVSFGGATDPENPVTYNIYYSDTTPINFGTADKIPGVTASPYKVDSLEHGQTYHFAVRAEDALGLEDDNTNEASTGTYDIPELKWLHPFGSVVFSSPTYNDVNGDNIDDIIVGGWSNSRVKALNGINGSPLWDTKLGDWVDSSPCLTPIGGSPVDDVLVGSYDGSLYALDGETGDSFWDFPTGGIVSSSPAVADIDDDGKLEAVFGSLDGFVYAVEMDGTEDWKVDTHDGVFSSPALCDWDNDGHYDIFVGSRTGDLWSIDDSGTVNWTFPTGGPINSSPAVGDIDDDGDMDVVVASMDGYVYAVDMLGSEVWNFEIEGYIWTSPSLGDINGDGALDVALGADNRDFYLIDGKTGDEIWHFPSGNRIWSSAALVDMSGDGVMDVIVGSNDGILWVIDGESGTELWHFDSENWIDSSPAVVDLDNDGYLEVIFGCANGYVYCINSNAPVPEPSLRVWQKFRREIMNIGSF